LILNSQPKTTLEIAATLKHSRQEGRFLVTEGAVWFPGEGSGITFYLPEEQSTNMEVL